MRHHTPIIRLDRIISISITSTTSEKLIQLKNVNYSPSTFCISNFLFQLHWEQPKKPYIGRINWRIEISMKYLIGRPGPTGVFGILPPMLIILLTVSITLITSRFSTRHRRCNEFKRGTADIFQAEGQQVWEITSIYEKQGFGNCACRPRSILDQENSN
jgi:hypothetical protein